MAEERKYINLPSRDWWQSLVRFLMFAVACLIAFGGLKLIFGFWNDFNLGFAVNGKYSLNQVVLFPWIAIEYCLIGLTAVCFCAWIKKGNLKQFSSNYNGIISLLVYGFCCLLLVLICFFGIATAVHGLVVGLFSILIILLSVLLIGVLVIGLILEFKVSDDELEQPAMNNPIPAEQEPQKEVSLGEGWQVEEAPPGLIEPESEEEENNPPVVVGGNN